MPAAVVVHAQRCMHTRLIFHRNCTQHYMQVADLDQRAPCLHAYIRVMLILLYTLL